MATIREIERSRGTVYYIIYAHYTEGKRKQIWYRCADKEKANEVLPIINKYEKDNLIFVENKYSDYSINTEITVKELLDKYVNHCTKSGKWQAQTLTENRGRINNYIIPIIGDVYLSHISPRSLQSYFDDLRFRQAVKGNHKNEPGNISTRTIEDIKKIVSPAFSYAVRMNYISLNPAASIEISKSKPQKREILSTEDTKTIFNSGGDDNIILALAIMLVCTLRSGELKGLTWDCVVSEGNKTKIIINKELERRNKKDIIDTKTKVLFEFPSTKKDPSTIVILKETKTKDSDRVNSVPCYLAEWLREYRLNQEKLKKQYGDEYYDYNLVFCQNNGKPHSNHTFDDRLKKILNKLGIKAVGLYSFRHGGATEKVRLCQNLDAVRQDMGQTGFDVLLEVYLHGNEEERERMAELLCNQFWENKKTDDLDEKE